MVKFRAPGLASTNSISFSKGILKSVLFSKGILSGGGARSPTTILQGENHLHLQRRVRDDQQFRPLPGRLTPADRELMAPGPDGCAAHYQDKPDQCTARALQSPGASPPATVMGSAYLNNPASANAVIGRAWRARCTFSVPSPNPACTGGFAGDTLCFNSDAANNSYTLGGFLATGGATILSGTEAALAANLNNTVFEFTGSVTVTNGQSIQAGHDDGLQLMIGNNLVINAPGPTAFSTTAVTYSGPSGTFPFDLVYGETQGPPAVLGISLPQTSQIVSLPGTPDPNNPNQLLFDLTQTGCPDCRPKRGRRTNGEYLQQRSHQRHLPGNVTVSVGQSCTFTNCEITGGLTINGGRAYLQNCKVDGGLTEVAGLLSVTGGSVVNGGVQISLASTYNIGPYARVNGGLTIQNTVNQPGTVCGTPGQRGSDSPK